MFIDFVPLLLINTMIGYFLLAGYVYAGMESGDQRRWAGGFLAVGAVSAVFGGLMAAGWPLPGAFNVAFGELSVLFGATFLAAGLAMAAGWGLGAVSWYGFFSGWAAVVIGVRIFQLGLTMSPKLSSAGFILSGAAGVAAPLVWTLRSSLALRALAALVLLAAGLIWGFTVYPAFWAHMAYFGAWKPPVMQTPGP